MLNLDFKSPCLECQNIELIVDNSPTKVTVGCKHRGFCKYYYLNRTDCIKIETPKPNKTLWTIEERANLWGKRIAKIQNKMHWSLRQMAKEMDVNVSTLSRIKNGIINPSKRIRDGISKYEATEEEG